MARLARFELTTLAFGGQYSIQLSYKRTVFARHLTHLARLLGALPSPRPWRDRPYGRRSLAFTEHETAPAKSNARTSLYTALFEKSSFFMHVDRIRP